MPIGVAKPNVRSLPAISTGTSDGPGFASATAFSLRSQSKSSGVRFEFVALILYRLTRVRKLTDGPVHAEVRVNDQGICILEVAARCVGGSCGRVLTHFLGVSLWEFILRHSGGLASYISFKSYLDFTANNKPFGRGVGFWMNKPSPSPKCGVTSVGHGCCRGSRAGREKRVSLEMNAAALLLAPIRRACAISRARDPFAKARNFLDKYWEIGEGQALRTVIDPLASGRRRTTSTSHVLFAFSHATLAFAWASASSSELKTKREYLHREYHPPPSSGSLRYSSNPNVPSTRAKTSTQ